MKFNLKLKLKQQIILLISLALLVPTLAITTFSIYQINKKATADIENFRDDEMSKLKLYLKHITDVAFGMVEARHQDVIASATPDGPLSEDQVRSIMTEQCLAELSKIRFDQGKGYFWVTNNQLPFPTMIMHAEKANLKGQVLDDTKHNVEKYASRNIYQVRAELCNKDGEAYVEYVMKKPGTEEVDNKLSYSRLYAPLGWIISTGFYTDQIEQSVQLKKDDLSRQIRQTIFFILAIAIVIISLGLLAAFYFSRQLTKAILLIMGKLKDLSNGLLVDKIETKRKDEVGEMTQSLNALVDGLRTYTSFAREIGKGNLVQEFRPLSSEDVLGNELLSMRDNLKKATDEKNIRDWVNEGLAILGEVLRKNNNDTRSLADEALKELVKYVKVNQGAMFVVTEHEDEKHLELLATYAYDKKKFIDRKVGWGEGLVGQCVLERSTVHLRDVPENYVSITSGLGKALPRSIVIVPLLYNNGVYGVIELASFKSFDAHEIAFIERVAESIASTIATVQVNERTRRLLEQSQQLSEEMKSQEEELRQNQEELQATSEQMRRRQSELEEENARLKQFTRTNA